MPSDTDSTIPVLIHINPDDWKAFKALKGKRRASLGVRELIRREIATATRSTQR